MDCSYGGLNFAVPTLLLSQKNKKQKKTNQKLDLFARRRGWLCSAMHLTWEIVFLVVFLSGLKGRVMVWLMPLLNVLINFLLCCNNETFPLLLSHMLERGTLILFFVWMMKILFYPKKTKRVFLFSFLVNLDNNFEKNPSGV